MVYLLGVYVTLEWKIDNLGVCVRACVCVCRSQQLFIWRRSEVNKKKKKEKGIVLRTFCLSYLQAATDIMYVFRQYTKSKFWYCVQ